MFVDERSYELVFFFGERLIRMPATKVRRSVESCPIAIRGIIISFHSERRVSPAGL